MRKGNVVPGIQEDVLPPVGVNPFQCVALKTLAKLPWPGMISERTGWAEGGHDHVVARR